jgi:hypothetical protein
MLPLVAGGLALGGKLMAAQQEEEDARKRALQGLSDAYASGSYAAPAAMPEGPSMMNLAGDAGLAAMDQGAANAAFAKANPGEEQTFGDDAETGLRAFMRGRM